jgi:hypothetical protein
MFSYLKLSFYWEKTFRSSWGKSPQLLSKSEVKKMFKIRFFMRIYSKKLIQSDPVIVTSDIGNSGYKQHISEAPADPMGRLNVKVFTYSQPVISSSFECQYIIISTTYRQFHQNSLGFWVSRVKIFQKIQTLKENHSKRQLILQLDDLIVQLII